MDVSVELGFLIWVSSSWFELREENKRDQHLPDDSEYLQWCLFSAFVYLLVLVDSAIANPANPRSPNEKAADTSHIPNTWRQPSSQLVRFIVLHS